MGVPRRHFDEYEDFVLQALSEYRKSSYDPVDPPPTVWFVPTVVLYDTYCRWMRRNAPTIHLLGERQFGQFVQHIFALWDQRRKTLRGGKRVWGYAGLDGPGAFQVPSKRGRRGTTRANPGSTEEV